MFKVIVLLVAVSTGAVAWARIKWANSKNTNTSKKLIEGLRSGNFTIRSMQESLGMLIRTKPLPEMPGEFQYRQHPRVLINQRFAGKFRIFYADAEPGGHGIVIAEAIFKDTIHATNINTDVNILYPCWIYIEPAVGEKQLYFRSSMPADKDHQYLLEDFSDILYNTCIK
jgi:hypothetical protein